MITRTDIIAHLERGMRAGFLKGMKQYTPKRSPFCREAPSDGAFEVYGDMGAVPWPRQITGQSGDVGNDDRLGVPQVGGLHEGGPITVLGANERALVVYNRGWDIPIGIYHDAINDARVGSLESWAADAGSRFEQHKDYLAFDALNEGAATTKYGACYDGLSFFNDSHVDPGAEYTTTQDNSYALALSIDNFETVYTAAHNILDDRGQPTGYVYDLLIHSVNLKRTAAQIVSNVEDYSTANRAINPFAGDVKGVMAPGGYLDSTAWVLACSQLNAKPINIQVRQAPQLVYWDDHTQGGGIRYYKWYSRYEVFYGEWRLAVLGNT